MFTREHLSNTPAGSPPQGRHRIPFVIGQNFRGLLRSDPSGNKWRLLQTVNIMLADSPGRGKSRPRAGTRSLCRKGFRVRFGARRSHMNG